MHDVPRVEMQISLPLKLILFPLFSLLLHMLAVCVKGMNKGKNCLDNFSSSILGILNALVLFILHDLLYQILKM